MAAEGASLLPSVTIVSRESTEFGEVFMASPYVRHTAADALARIHPSSEHGRTWSPTSPSGFPRLGEGEGH